MSDVQGKGGEGAGGGGYAAAGGAVQVEGGGEVDAGHPEPEGFGAEAHGGLQADEGDEREDGAVSPLEGQVGPGMGGPRQEGMRDGPAPLTEHQEELKAEFTRNRGYWHPFWDNMLELDPEIFKAYTDFSSVPWKTGPLEPKVKEFIYTAFDAGD